MPMRPYWITFKRLPYPTPLNLGAGVTAYSPQEAVELFRSATAEEIEIASVAVVEQVEDLEQNHVVPNMGNLLLRGIWYPLGYR